MDQPSMSRLQPLYPILYRDLVSSSLREDLGRAGDLTSDAVIPAEAQARALLRARSPGSLAGLEVALEAFQQLDPEVSIERWAKDGDEVQAGMPLAEVFGRAREILSAERTALNFLCHLSGIATTTQAIVRAIAGHGAEVVCTRKTTPLLRSLEKYAVRAGGGANHRFGLDDAILIKDNHRLIAGSAAEAVRRARARAGHLVKIEIEVDDLGELEELLELGVDVVLLDNTSLEELRLAVRVIDGRAVSEASGGITLESAPDIAATGVDLLSVGWLTHSAPVLDIGLDFQPQT
jgi:nicotinate-nucleotide pyrophosphorylase (carboxylating)